MSKVNDATSAVGEILDLSNKCIEVGQQIKTREAAIEQNRKDAGEVAEAAAELERQNARLAEKLSSWEASAEEKAAAAASANEELREKLLEQRRRKATAAAAHGDEDRACEALTARIEAEAVEQRRKLAELGAAWQRLEATVQAQQRALLAACAGGGLAGGAAQASGAPPAPHMAGFTHGGYDAYAAMPPPTPLVAGSFYGAAAATPVGSFYGGYGGAVAPTPMSGRFGRTTAPPTDYSSVNAC